jgi:leucyl-tRNA synthetase
MNDTYAPSAIEAAAQAHWQATHAHRVVEDPNRPKFYACSMLPYPSGKLHMGHVRNYTINDMMARQLRMKGYNVLMPMGWDAFGLPAENAAIDKKVAPATWTRDNIADMKAQMQPLGLAFDWSREVATCDEAYYRWNQWMFLKMLERGTAYMKTQVVNWDPVDQTVLANEQVENGRGWRSGALVEKREIPGYYLAITQYAQELLDNVADPAAPGYLAGWPERVRSMQEHWIGKSQGVRFAFTHAIPNAQGQLIDDGRLWVFTTRADTIMGVTFCAVAPEHPLATQAALGNPALAAFIQRCKAGGTTEADLATRDKEGMPTGLVVQHPLTEQPVPVWVGNYVLMGYGDGAVMGVPAHDERDFAFALKYHLPITQVVMVDSEPHFNPKQWHDWYADKTRGVVINSDNFSGLTSAQAVQAIAQALSRRGLGDLKTTWRLRDWGISRQRYWGTPIPIIHCKACGAVPVPLQDLPVRLPVDLLPDGSGNPLNKSASFLNVPCPRCAQPAQRETDTMDTFVDSAWYYMRYCCPDSDASMVDARTAYWMAAPPAASATAARAPAGMDQYIGGIEHAVLHLLYARFWTKVMRDMGLVAFDEPFAKLFTQGMLLNECYYREAPAGSEGKRRWFYPSEVDITHDERGAPVSAVAREDGLPVLLGGIEKMSKSKNNVVEPRDIIARFGADTARVFTMFAGPPDQSATWSDSGAEGSYRFLRRLWACAVRRRDTVRGASDRVGEPSSAAAALRRDVHATLKQIDHDYERLQYNTVISGAMKLLNAIDAAKLDSSNADDRATLHEAFGILIRVIYPAAPHIAHALWLELDFARTHGDLVSAAWPHVDERALVQSTITLVLQINGKTRGQLHVPAQASDATITAAALATPEFERFGEGKAVRLVKVVPGRLVNVVV